MRRGIRRVRRRLDRAVARGAPQPGRPADDVEGVRVRVVSGGFAVAAPDTAALLEERRAPAPISGPAARIAAAALREPRFDSAPTIAERERMRAALAAAGYDVPPAAGNFVWLRSDEPLGERLEEQGLIVRRFAQGIRITLRRPSENDLLLRALGVEPGSAPGRAATVIRTTTETALRITLDLDGVGPGAGRDRDRLPRPPADAARVPRRLRSRAASRAATSTSTSTTRSRTSSPRSAARSRRRSERAKG